MSDNDRPICLPVCRQFRKELFSSSMTRMPVDIKTLLGEFDVKELDWLLGTNLFPLVQKGFSRFRNSSPKTGKLTQRCMIP